jgi:uncharacterized membrane protein (DUF485 family)
VDTSVERRDSTEDITRQFQSIPPRRFAYALGLFLIFALLSALSGYALVVGHIHHRDDIEGTIFFSLLVVLPTLGQALSTLYVMRVRVRIDADTFLKSSPYGRVSFPLEAITGLGWRDTRNGQSLAIEAGGHTVRCSVELFGKAQLEDMRATLLARAPNKELEQPAAERPNPSVTFGQVMAAIAFGLVFYGVGFLNLVGLKSRFVPTPLGGAVVSGAAVLLGLLVGGWFLSLVRPWRSPADARVQRTKGQVWAIGIALFLLMGVGATTLGHGMLSVIACWYTDLEGSVGRRVVTVAGYSGGSCKAFRIAEVDPLDDAFCAEAGYMHRHPIGSKLTLVGPTSALGSDIAPLSETNP